MKSTVPFMVCAIFALSPLPLANAQTSPGRSTPAATKLPPATSKSSSADAATTGSTSTGSAASSESKMRTDVYHVHFTKAALGKSAQLGDDLKKPDPQDPMSGHTLVLRHQEGDSWDYAVIQHLGTKATVDPTRPAPSPAVRNLSDWHNDTYVSGPSWADFTKAMGIDDNKAKTAGSVYILSVYRPAAGHREDLEKMLSESPTAGDPTAGNVVLQHLEGSAWTFLAVARYNSWSDYATSESKNVAETVKGEGGWFRLREHASFHTDTVCDRIAP